MRIEPCATATRCARGLGRHVDHVGLAVGVEVRQRRRSASVMIGNVAAMWPVHDSHRSDEQSSRPLMLAAALAAACPRRSSRRPAPRRRRRPRRRSACPRSATAAGEDFTVGTERRLGDQIMARVAPRPGLPRRPAAARLPAVALVAAAGRGAPARRHHGRDRHAAAWETFLVRDRSVNAFALPGGFVGVHLGLIAMTASRDELASVLAHELSHVTQRHIARGIASASRQSLVGLAAMLLGVLAASRAGSGDAAQAVIVGSQAAMVQGQLNFSRDMEREADRIGWGVLQRRRLRAGRHGRDVREARQRLAPERQRCLPLPALAPADGRAHRRGAHPRRGRSRPAQRRPVAAGPPADAGPRPRADGQQRAMRCAASRSWTHRRPPKPSRRSSGSCRCTPVRWRRCNCATPHARRPPSTPRWPLARSAAPGDARAARALALLQAQVLQANGQAQRALALLDAPALAAASTGRRCGAAAAAGARAGGPGGCARRRQQRRAARQHRGAADLGRRASQRRRGVVAAGAVRRRARVAPALAARRGRGARRARRPQRRDRPPARRPAPGAQRHGAPDFIEASIIDARLRDLSAQRRAQLAAARGEREERPPQ